MADPSRFLDTHKVVVAFPPACPNTAAIDGSTYLLGDRVHMGKYNHLTAMIFGGAMDGASGVVTVKQSSDFAGTGAKNVTITERFLCTATSAASDTWVSTAVSSNTWTYPATNYLHNIVEVDARDLDLANGFEYVGVQVEASGNANDRMCIVYILSENRYALAESSPTAIA